MINTDGPDRRGAGGTPGGVGEFLLGAVMAAAGGYLLLNQVQVTSAFWQAWGGHSFGLSLLPFVVGVAILFFNGKSVTGWLLAVLGLTIIVAGVLVNLDIYFRPTSLYNTLIMLTLLAGGIGLLVRALKPRGGPPASGETGGR
jgi:uncharacterized protein